MSLIDVITTGNGVAWVDNPDPVQGDTVTLNAIPDTGETLDDIQAWDEHGYSIALYVQQVQQFTWNYGSMTISVTFSGTPTPPTPTTPRKRKHMPIWMYPCLHR